MSRSEQKSIFVILLNPAAIGMPWLGSHKRKPATQLAHTALR
ncbi:MAG: hypothetical protein ACLP1Y_03570 [Candidatus Acidiferrales bacterium]